MFRKATTLGVIGLALGMSVAITACDVLSIFPLSGGADRSADTGTLRVLVADTPFPFEFIEEASITITRVEVRLGETESECSDDADCDDGDPCTDDACVDGVCVNTPNDCNEGNGNDADGNDEDGDEDGNDNDGDDDDGSPFIVIFQGEREFNLLDLQNGRTDLLADTEIPAGTYTQMRLIVTSGEVVLDDENMTTFPLTVPSGSQTGIKLHFEFTVEADGETTLLLDVDVSKAFLPIPGGRIEDPSTIREFKFKPSVAMRLINLIEAGSIAGSVTNSSGEPLRDVTVTAFDGETQVTGTATDADGTYVLSGLPPGEYRVEFSAVGFGDVIVEGVSVTAGATTEGVDAEMTAS